MDREERMHSLKERGALITEARRLKELVVDETTRKAFFDYMAANGIGEGFGMSEKE